MAEKKLDILTVKLRNTIKRFTKRKKIVFVCTGNTCRSPMAEQIFRNYLKSKDFLDKYYVESAGLYVTEKYDGMNVLARQALTALEIKFGRHIPSQLDIVTVTGAYRVICMEQFHKDAIVKTVGDLPHIKTIDEITNRGDIPDPYGTDFNKYIETAKRLEAMCESILEDLELSEKDEVDAKIESGELEDPEAKRKKRKTKADKGDSVDKAGKKPAKKKKSKNNDIQEGSQEAQLDVDAADGSADISQDLQSQQTDSGENNKDGDGAADVVETTDKDLEEAISSNQSEQIQTENLNSDEN